MSSSQTTENLKATPVCKPEIHSPQVYATLTLMFDADRLTRLVNELSTNQSTKLAWTKAQVENLETKNSRQKGTKRLREMIEPMFIDIADRERNTFITDFLYDADSLCHEKLIHEHKDFIKEKGLKSDDNNISRVIDIVIPTIKWETESKTVHLEKPSSDFKFKLSRVICRSFWIVHSNLSVSFHISFELPEPIDEHKDEDKPLELRITQSYAVSIFQKLFNPSEGTAYLLESGSADAVKVTDYFIPENEDPSNLWYWSDANITQNDSPTERTFIDFILHETTRQLQQLLSSAFERQSIVSKDVNELDTAQVWKFLFSTQNEVAKKEVADTSDPKVKQWFGFSQRNRRSLFVYKSPDAFSKIREMAIYGEKDSWSKFSDQHLKDIDSFEEKYTTPLTDNESKQSVVQISTENLARYFYRPGKEIQDSILAAEIVFLSGFFQNIIDFMAQDSAEIQDAICPICPQPSESSNASTIGSQDSYLIYATPYSTFELVSQSRSLDTGRSTIGTCPYILLVHLMSFQNEVLTYRFETEVTGLIMHYEKVTVGHLMTSPTHGAVETLFERVSKYKAQVFSNVHKHFWLNVFRYPTEQAIFGQLQSVRGVVTRLAHWNGILERLNDSVQSLSDDASRKKDSVLNRILLTIAAVGIFQVVFQVHDSLLETAKYHHNVSSNAPPTLDKDRVEAMKLLSDASDIRLSLVNQRKEEISRLEKTLRQNADKKNTLQKEEIQTIRSNIERLQEEEKAYGKSNNGPNHLLVDDFCDQVARLVIKKREDGTKLDWRWSSINSDKLNQQLLDEIKQCQIILGKSPQVNHDSKSQGNASKGNGQASLSNSSLTGADERSAEQHIRNLGRYSVWLLVFVVVLGASWFVLPKLVRIIEFLSICWHSPNDIKEFLIRAQFGNWLIKTGVVLAIAIMVTWYFYRSVAH